MTATIQICFNDGGIVHEIYNFSYTHPILALIIGLILAFLFVWLMQKFTIRRNQDG